VGATGFLHDFVPGTDLHADLPLTAEFFGQLEKLFADLHERHVAYVDSNKRENILFGEDGRPWLIDFQIFVLSDTRGAGQLSGEVAVPAICAGGLVSLLQSTRRVCCRRHARRRILCGPESAGFCMRFTGGLARPFIVMRRKFLARYDLANTR